MDLPGNGFPAKRSLKGTLMITLGAMNELLNKVEDVVGAGSYSAKLDVTSVVVYGDIHGEPEMAAEALRDAKDGKQVVVLGDLAYRSASWDNKPGQMLETLITLFEAMAYHGAVLLQGNCDSNSYGLMPGVIMDETYPDLITDWRVQVECAKRFDRIFGKLPVVATTPDAMMAHGCLTPGMEAEAVMWSVFNPEIETDRPYAKFGNPSQEICWMTVKAKLDQRQTLLIGHQKKPAVKKQGYQVDYNGRHQVITLMSSSQNGSVKQPVKCILNGNDAKFEPVPSDYQKFWFEEGHDH